ncbi:MAG: hypothetical protein IID44_09040 [Planctomycetes bacterium]|nr:hypothetical protein [Planctomycetota bacterium]
MCSTQVPMPRSEIHDLLNVEGRNEVVEQHDTRRVEIKQLRHAALGAGLLVLLGRHASPGQAEATTFRRQPATGHRLAVSGRSEQHHAAFDRRAVLAQGRRLVQAIRCRRFAADLRNFKTYVSGLAMKKCDTYFSNDR